MDNNSFNEVSPITLGTVQLGIPYGIANKKGQPTDIDAQNILNFAWKNGINSFDTAPAYGESEKRIGIFIKELKSNSSQKKPIVISKIPGNFGNNENPSEIYINIKKSIEDSLKKLNLESLTYCLLHKASDMTNQNICNSLLELKKEGLIKNIGVSIYTPEEVTQFLDLKIFDAIQIPINIFDHRLISSGLLNELKNKAKIVFARSIFLQGLFFVEIPNLTPHLTRIKPFLQDFQDIALKNNYTYSQLALAFARDLPGISSLVLGVETIEQLSQNLKDMEVKQIEKSVMNEILSKFSSIPVDLIDPSKWKK